jgi:AraC family transcriptional regulator of arabinose operon
MAMNALERLILSCFQLQQISKRHVHDPRINAVCNYLNEHITQEIKIETLAAMVFVAFAAGTSFQERSWANHSRLARNAAY